MEKRKDTKELAKFKWENLTLIRYKPYSDLEKVSEISKKKTNEYPWGDQEKNLKDPSLGVWTIDKVFDNVEEQKWLKLAFDDCYEAHTKRLTIVLEQDGEDKVRLGIYKFQKLRRVGKKHFHKHRENYYVTFNLKTGDFYYTTSNFYKRKMRTSTNKNPLIVPPPQQISYEELLSFMRIPNFSVTTTDKTPYIKTALAKSQIQIEIATALTHIQSQIYYKVLSKDYTIKELEKQFKSCFGFHSNVTLDAANFHNVIHLMSAAWFVKAKKIKCPNLWGHVLTTFYPGMRKIKRNKMKLVAATLDYYNIKSKSNIGVFNQNPDLSYPEFAAIQKVLGLDFIKNVNHSYFHKDTKEYKEQRDGLLPDFAQHEYGEGLTTYEKRNIVKILNDGKNLVKLRWTELMDHLNQRHKLNNKYNEKVKIKAKNMDEFTEEHSDWATKLHYHESNTRTVLIHDETLIKAIPERIKVKDVGYYPILLKSDLDYFKEGQHQTSCVRTYVTQKNCYIISIRKGDPDGGERATCEFRYEGKSLNPQNRLKRNVSLTNDWEEVISQFKTKLYCNIKKYPNSDELNLVPHSVETEYVKDSYKLTKNVEFYEFNDDLPF